MKYFSPSQDPAEGLGVLMLFRLIEESVPAFFRADRRILITRAPGRLDVIGGLGGVPGALTVQLPTAEAACAAIQGRDDDLVRLWSPCRDGSRTQMLSMRLADLGLPGAPIAYDEARALLTAEPRDRWAGYLLGSLLVLARERGLALQHGVELLLHSDVPEGRGVAASAAITVAALRAFALHFGLDLTAAEIARLGQLVERDVLAMPGRVSDAMAAVAGHSGELLVHGAATGSEQRLAVPSDLEFIGLDTGTRSADVPPAAARDGEAARSDRFRALLSEEPTPALRQELGELMFASHQAYAAAGLANAAADLVVDVARRRRDAGGAVLGARLSGRGGGGTVVLLGSRGKIWYEALRVKKALLEATGHSGHIFRWSSPGALAFGVIELTPMAGA